MKYWIITVDLRITGIDSFVVSHPVKPTEKEIIDKYLYEFNDEEEHIDIEELDINNIPKL